MTDTTNHTDDSKDQIAESIDYEVTFDDDPDTAIPAEHTEITEISETPDMSDNDTSAQAASRLDHEMEAEKRDVRESVFKSYPLYSFQNVTLVERKSGTAVLDGVNFECQAGRAYAILVPDDNPLMHTMLLSVMCGITLPSSGHVLSKSTSFAEMAPAEIRGYRLGLVMPQFPIRADLTAEQNLLYAMDASNRNFLNTKSVIARDLLKKVGFGTSASAVTSNGTKAGKLPPLEMMRVSVARAISRDPEIVIADEPCATLSGEDSDTMIKLLKAQTHGHNKSRAVIVVTEDPQVARKVGNVIKL